MNFRAGVSSKCFDALKFTCYNAEEIRKISVKEITNPRSLDALLNPTENGLYDPVLGPPTRMDMCKTCGLASLSCPGHLGHIELPLPVYQPAFFKTLFYLLRASCLKCHHVLINRKKMYFLLYKLKALNAGLFQLADELDQKAAMDALDSTKEMLLLALEKLYRDALAKQGKTYHDKTNFSRNVTQLRRSLVQQFLELSLTKIKCELCGTMRPSIRVEQNSRVFLIESNEETNESTQYYLTPVDVRERLSKLYSNDKDIIENVFQTFHDAGSADESDSGSEGVGPGKTVPSALDVLFLTVLAVPPSKYRPVMCINDTQYENPQTTVYSKIILDCILLRTLASSNLNDGEMEEKDVTEGLSSGKTDMWKKNSDYPELSDKSFSMLSLIPGKTKSEKLENCWQRLQKHVNSIFDSESGSKIDAAAPEVSPGVKQKLEKKAGLFRKNMMGKRVNYAARSVISPDPYIATDEIGVPLCFASKLTYPTPVTSWNFRKLRQCVINGPDVYPGATMVVQSDGTATRLKGDNLRQREALAKQLYAQPNVSKKRKPGLKTVQTVHRHMENGDVMLLNRQPTLHKGSIMAHKVRVLPGEKTLRLHYANCKSYNADFDGDEMNAHFPQSELCRAEAFNLMSTNSQYLTCKDGKPLSGLIQDHMVAGVHMSVRGRFFTKEQYQQLCFNAMTHIRRKLKTLPPAIWKPKKLWSGKQVFSTILLNIVPVGSPLLNLQGVSKIRNTDWVNKPTKHCNMGDTEMCESQVIIRQSELLCGVLDKNHYGASAYGLVHSMYELYGCQYSGELLTCLARVFTAFLQQYRGFSLGVEDILVLKRADKGRTRAIRSTLDEGQTDVASALNVEDPEDIQEITSKMQDAHISKITGKDELAAVDHAMKRASNHVNDRITKHCTGNGLLKTFPNNNLQLMVISGAKGGQVNCMQISCLLGQIELEGRRPPLMVSGRSVPSFQKYDISLRAGGFISQRFLTGIRPQEYFFHCMAGREGLVDTAVKTSRSGYLQRCLIKHLEGLVLAYDLSVRDSDGSVMQFLYGEDGIDISKQSHLNLKQHDFLVNNLEAESRLLPSMDIIESSAIDSKTAEKMWRKLSRHLKRKRKAEKRMTKERGEVAERNSAFLEFSFQNRGTTKRQAIDAWRRLSSDEKQGYKEKIALLQKPDPICSQLGPNVYLGSMSEKFRDELDLYLKRNPDDLPGKLKKSSLPTLDRVKAMLSLKYQKALCDPGESVGVLAAQSIGEPSTQMTLNTFHFAGRGDMNVTLGIPRLREILMTAARRIKTPQVFVPVHPGQLRKAEKLRKRLSSVKLQEVLHKIYVEEHLEVDWEVEGQRSRQSKIRIELLPEKQFRKELAVTRNSALRFIENTERGLIRPKRIRKPKRPDGQLTTVHRFLPHVILVIADRLKQRLEEEIVFTAKASGEDGVITDSTQNPESEEVLDTAKADNNQDQSEDDEAFDDDDAKKGKNRQDFEEEEEEIVEEDVENVESTLNEVTESNSVSVAGEKSADMDDVRNRVRDVMQAGTSQIRVLHYEFDHKENGWCTILLQMPLTTAQLNIVSVVEAEVKSTFVRRVQGITRCLLQTNPRDPDDVKFATEGINLRKLFEYPEILDLSRLQCNCVHSVEKTYGIEAAVRVISREVANVFAVYGIQVNQRHLTLVADYMCFSGAYKAFNRSGIEPCSSPLQQMTFESTVSFLKDAVLSGQWDNLQSPSARIVAGQVVKTGSGYFSLRVPMQDCT